MLSADAAFEAAANAAALAFAREPAALRYRVRVSIRRAAATTATESLVVLDTASGSATVRTAGASDRSGPPPALPIALDALAEWGFHLDDTGADARLAVAYEHPRSYRAEAPEAGVDVAVTSVRGYRVTYVPGVPNEVRLDPATPEMREYASGADDFVYRDVTFDPATMLPTRVVLTAPRQTLTLDYTVADGHWLLAHVLDDDDSNERAKTALLELDARYDDVAAPVPDVATPTQAPALATPEALRGP